MSEQAWYLGWAAIFTIFAVGSALLSLMPAPLWVQGLYIVYTVIALVFGKCCHRDAQKAKEQGR